MRPIIVVNDPTSDAGQVLEGSPSTFINGLYKGDPKNAELANRGLHRHENASHPKVKPRDNRSLFRNAYDQLSSPESDA